MNKLYLTKERESNQDVPDLETSKCSLKFKPIQGRDERDKR